ncbi:MAG: tRNA (adenosine(37)-N6)-threonylcarbamoyltransferase complex ATPase subunit type 1 TsaE [Aquificota bacterium]|nr:tRNA (adenosine(37)-N6)-threonylcarbamoyltransferase complex ATPase subunit type 1 TsaE [Aquificota bacterium]MDQ7081982.1 tRNA (adenosine(37)-N6)-threonylcarbamoyltransferase complex ATPase subunit type 1 TsaE [Aquificota bacterium]
MKELKVRTPGEMEALGEALARDLKGREVICLRGPLGSGKTTFVRGLARGMGIKEGHQVRSPTFTLVNEYPTEKGKLIHVDLYRVRDFDWSEFVGQGVVVVEWCEEEALCDIAVDIALEGEDRVVRIRRLSETP